MSEYIACYGPAQGSHSDRKGIRAKAQEKSGYGEESDTQTLSMFLRHAVAIYLLQCRIIYYYKQRTWQRHTSSDHKIEKNSIKQFHKENL